MRMNKTFSKLRKQSCSITHWLSCPSQPRIRDFDWRKKLCCLRMIHRRKLQRNNHMTSPHHNYTFPLRSISSGKAAESKLCINYYSSNNRWETCQKLLPYCSHMKEIFHSWLIHLSEVNKTSVYLLIRLTQPRSWTAETTTTGYLTSLDDIKGVYSVVGDVTTLLDQTTAN